MMGIDSGSNPKIELLNPERAHTEIRMNGDLEAGAADEVETGAIRTSQPERDGYRYLALTEQLSEKTVQVRGSDDQLQILRRRLQASLQLPVAKIDSKARGCAFRL